MTSVTPLATEIFLYRAACHSSFLWAKGHYANAVHSEMCPAYGEKCFKRPVIQA